jgi:hypothetical protein
MVIKEQHRITLVCAALVIGTALLYWPVVAFDFVNFDDKSYVFGNPNLSGGFSWRGLFWCFQAGYASNWHPLTWMTHMLDSQMFGLNPAGHHAVNLALHTANVVLLFLVLKRMTAALWRSALVAALFAWHPLHVESVAWVAELKDVMSTLFWMLAVWAYVLYAEEDKAKASAMMAPEGRDSKQKAFYIAALVFFALGLMAKPMVVTLPCALLLLDFWPLRRFHVASNGSAPVSPWLRLVREKAPLFPLGCRGLHPNGGRASSRRIGFFLAAVARRSTLRQCPGGISQLLGKTGMAVWHERDLPARQLLPIWENRSGRAPPGNPLGGRHRGAREPALWTDGLAVVFGNSCADHRHPAGGSSKHGRPLHLHPIHRPFHRRLLGGT